jgi:ribosomal protein S14
MQNALNRYQTAVEEERGAYERAIQAYAARLDNMEDVLYDLHRKYGKVVLALQALLRETKQNDRCTVCEEQLAALDKLFVCRYCRHAIHATCGHQRNTCPSCNREKAYKYDLSIILKD